MKTKLILIVLVMFTGCLATGCADSAQNNATMKFLIDGQARGHIVLTAGGSPVAAGMKQTFFLGSENAALSFDGNIDFAKAADAQPGKIEPETAVVE